jgi:hypothetical protein
MSVKRIPVTVVLSPALFLTLCLMLALPGAPALALAQSPDGPPPGGGGGVTAAGPQTVSPANTAAPQATVTRVSDIQVIDYQPVGAATYHVKESLTGSLPTPHTWYLNNFDPNHLTNLTFTWAGGGSCTKQPDNDIYCTGTLTQFEVTYDYYSTPPVYGARVKLGWWGYSTNFSMDYTIKVSYPDPLVFIESLDSPPVHIGNQLTWYQANTYRMDAFSLFYDPRIHVVGLPVILKQAD